METVLHKSKVVTEEKNSLADLGPFVSTKALSIEEFNQYCEAHPDLFLEQNPSGKIILMSPIHLNSGYYEAEIIGDLIAYARSKKSGKVYSSSTGFRLPDGSLRSPDAAWVSNEQLNKLSEKDHKTFAKIVPEFIIELRSDTDSLSVLKKKMHDTWIANGVLLAWLIDPQTQKSFIYRQDGSITVINGFDNILSGEKVLIGFEFDLKLLLS